MLPLRGAFILTLGLGLSAFAPARGDDLAREVFSILSDHCWKCHGPEKQKSGYRLDDRRIAMPGGDSGRAAIVSSNSSASALVQRLTTTNADEMMPPKGARLSSDQIAAIREWIDSGAPWPAQLADSKQRPSTHWSFQPVQRQEVPRVKSAKWVRNSIDNFVLARLEKEHLKPSPEAERATLIRRLYLDLLGLPPTAAQVESFVKDRRHDAYKRQVEVVLASPHFGERWGRHWLDLARYADSAGYQIDRVRPGAYLYRNWVIDSFNHDQPFDQFTIEQIAGDLLPQAALEQKIATGFHRMTLSNLEDGVDKEEFECKAKVDRVSTTATAWLGLTVGCAECHTHKFDPITQREFYQLYAFFNAAAEIDVPVPNAGGREKFERSKKSWDLEKLRIEAERTAYSQSNLAANQLAWERSVPRSSVPGHIAEILGIPPAQRAAAPRRELGKFYRDLDPELKRFAERLKAHQRTLPKYKEEQAMLLVARTNAPKTFVHVRGDFLRPGEEVKPGVLQALNRFDPATEPTRLDLARWLVAPENPLTARVAVNRVWQAIFGGGLVETPEDFGTRTAVPEFPELLDWLADEFKRSGWSRKQMLRLIVTSATYRQSSYVSGEQLVRDPQNILLARQGRYRVEAEIIRDLFLGASGLLEEELGGPGIYPPIPEDIKAVGYGTGGTWAETEAPEKHRRGLYVINRRTVPYPVAMTFDQANPNECTARRERSNTPLQPLALLNNPVFAECAEALARRMGQTDGDTRRKLEFGFRTCLGRPPTRAESKRLDQLVRDEGKLAGASEAQAWRAVADVLLNLDEFITRE